MKAARAPAPSTLAARSSLGVSASVHEALRSPGRPLEPATRRLMESPFAHDFSRVRVHCDESAARAARAVHASAFTVGHDVVFGAGQYRPTTTGGQALVAHELAHVVQQGHRVGPEAPVRIGEADSPVEREADAAAAAVVNYRPVVVGPRSVSPLLQRQLAPVPTYGVTPTAAKIADVEVETFGEMLSAARDPSTGTMHIVGSGRDYFKRHAVTERIREDFFWMMAGKVRDSKWFSGKLTGTHRPGLTIYGGAMWDFTAENLFSKATWMIGKNDSPTIDYVLFYARIPSGFADRKAWSLTWRAVWKIRDNLDLKPGTDQTPFYNKVAKPAGWLWHDVLGGKSSAPVHIDWTEVGKREFLDPSVKPFRILRPGDVRQQ